MLIASASKVLTVNLSCHSTQLTVWPVNALLTVNSTLCLYLLQDLHTAFMQHTLPQSPVIPVQDPSAQSNREDELDKDSGSKVTIWPIKSQSNCYFILPACMLVILCSARFVGYLVLLFWPNADGKTIR